MDSSPGTCDVYLRTEPGVGLTTLLGIGLEDGLILMIPKRDQSSLLLDIISCVWGWGWGRIALSLYFNGLLDALSVHVCVSTSDGKAFSPAHELPV